MTVVVSITPAAVGRDSRTFKQAASFARLGHRSIVVESESSPARMAEGGFELISLGADPGGAAPAGAAKAGGEAPAAPELNLAGRARVGLVHALEPLRSSVATLRLNRDVASALPAAGVYVAHGWNRLPAAWAAARRHGGAVVYDAHDSYFERYPPEHDPYTSALTPRLFAGAEGEMARRSAGFLTVSEGVADLLERRIGRRPEVIVNYPDTRLDRDGGSDVRTAVGAKQGDFLLVSVGNAKAGVDVAAGIDAIAELPDRFRLVLIGAGIEPYRAKLRESGLESRVDLLPPMPPDEINRFIATADAGLILFWGITPDFEAALPNRLFHAIAAGLPVLYPDLPEIAALAREHGLGTAIDARDPGSIAAAARRLAGDPELLAGMRASVASASRELTWERQEPSLEGALESALLDGRPGRG